MLYITFTSIDNIADIERAVKQMVEWRGTAICTYRPDESNNQHTSITISSSNMDIIAAYSFCLGKQILLNKFDNKYSAVR